MLTQVDVDSTASARAQLDVVMEGNLGYGLDGIR